MESAKILRINDELLCFLWLPRETKDRTDLLYSKFVIFLKEKGIDLFCKCPEHTQQD